MGPLLSALIYYKFANFDAALNNISENIRISQSKSDKYSIMSGLLVNSLILGKMGMIAK